MAANENDNSLLDRLNALKTPSNTPTPHAVSSKTPVTQPNDSDIESRFRRLASGSKLAAPGPSQRDGALRDPIEDLPSETKANEEDEQTLDELLAELGEPDDSWLEGGPEDNSVEGLLREAKAALPKEGDAENEEEGNDSAEEHGSKHGSDRGDEEAADEYIAQALAEAELEKKHNPPSAESSEEAAEHEDTDEANQESTETNPSSLLDLPSAPQSAPVTDSTPVPDEDDLTARLTALSLPRTPSAAPKTKPKSKKTKTDNLPKYTDEDIDSWCVICNEDATLRCLGCEGDLYCAECWNEGHRGPDAGFEEKRHKAVVYVKGKKAVAA
jgi:hypothetical protein